MKLYHLATALTVASLAPAATASAATLTVTTAWEDPSGRSCSLRNAIIAANQNASEGACVGIGAFGDDTIRFDTGGQDIILTAALPAIAAKSEAGTLVIDGTLSLSDRQVLDGDNTHRVLHAAPGSELTLQDLRIKNGNAADRGGGVFSEGKLTVHRTFFKGNQSGTFGGAIAATGGDLRVDEDTNFLENLAAMGGGIYAERYAVILDSYFASNAAAPCFEALQESCGGAAIALIRSSELEFAFIEQAVFVDNEESAVRIRGPHNTQIAGCSFAGNINTDQTHVGTALDTWSYELPASELRLDGNLFLLNGAPGRRTAASVNARGANVEIDACQFERNWGGLLGGGARVTLHATNTALIRRSGFLENVGGVFGGGLALAGWENAEGKISSATVVNSTFLDHPYNEETMQGYIRGSEISALDLQLYLVNSTLANRDPRVMGLIFLNQSEMVIENTIISGNPDSDYSDCEDFGAEVSGHSNLVTNYGNGMSDPCGIVTGEPAHLDAPIYTAAGTIARPILPESPANGTGAPATCSGPVVQAIDQRGAARYPSVCDKGAYELDAIGDGR